VVSEITDHNRQSSDTIVQAIMEYLLLAGVPQDRITTRL
jgi:hypothetical protein